MSMQTKAKAKLCCSVSLMLVSLFMASCSTVKLPDIGFGGSADAPRTAATVPTKATTPQPVTPSAMQQTGTQKKREMTSTPVRKKGAASVSRPDTIVALPVEKRQEVSAVASVVSAVAPQKNKGKASVSVNEFEGLPPNTVVVHSGKKDRSHPYFHKGSKLGFTINGVQGKALVVARGSVLTFKVSTNIRHDFYLATKGVGRGGFTLAKGVKGNFLYDGELTFRPTETTPSVVYYACRNHPYMGGPIFVKDKGKPFDLTAALAKLKKQQGTGTRRVGKGNVSSQQARQKLDFTRMYVLQSAAARRIQSGKNLQAKRLLVQAKKMLQQADTAFSAAQYGQSVESANAAMKRMSDAGRLAPAQNTAVDNHAAKVKYAEMLDGLNTYRKSYVRHHRRLSKAGQTQSQKTKGLPEVDLGKVDATTERARRLADAEDYDQASRLLMKAQTTLTTALSSMLNNATLSYELNFDNPKDEYEYEVSRYKSYEELVPLAIEQHHPSRSMQSLMRKYVDRGKEIQGMAVPVAAQGDYKKAIQMMQGATSQVRRALRMLGVR